MSTIASVCPRCGSTLVPTKNLKNETHKFFKVCPGLACRTMVNDVFGPTDYQVDVMAQAELGGVIGFFGGYGSGKTSSAAWALFSHIKQTPGGVSLLGAASWRQLIKTSMIEMAELIPKVMVKSFNLVISDKVGALDVVFNNGHVLSAAVLSDEENLRSLNLTAVWIEEASAVKYSLFSQLETRLRHHAAVDYEYDEYGGIVSEAFIDPNGLLKTRPKQIGARHLLLLTSNPDVGWIRTDMLFYTPENQIRYYGHDPVIEQSLHAPLHVKKANYHAFITPSTANYHLPEGYIEKISAGKTQAWIERYIKGSFKFAEGMVYPSAPTHFVKPFEIPAHWKRMIVTDFGRRDATAHAVFAIDPEKGILYMYDEFKLSNGDEHEWIKGFYDLYNPVNPTAWLFPPLGDPAGQSKGQANAQSWFDLYADHGIYYMPFKTGKGTDMRIAPGIALVNAYFEAGKLKIFSTCTETIAEINEYQYPTASLMELDDEARKTENPRDFNNHLMDTLRGAVSMLPRDITQPLTALVPTYISNSVRGAASAEDYFVEVHSHPSEDSFWKAPKSDPYAFNYGSSSDDDFELY